MDLKFRTVKVLFFIYSNMCKWGGEILDNNLSINIAKKEIKKAIINELYKKEVIEFNQYNFIIRKIDEDISKHEKENKTEGNLKQIIVDVVG